MKSIHWVGILCLLIFHFACSDSKTGIGTTGNLTVNEQAVDPFVGDWDVFLGQSDGTIKVSKDQVEIDFTGDALIGQVVTNKVTIDVNNSPALPVDTDIGTIELTVSENLAKFETKAAEENDHVNRNFNGSVTRPDGNNATFSGRFSRSDIEGTWQAIVNGENYQGQIAAVKRSTPGGGGGACQTGGTFGGTWQGTYQCTNTCPGGEPSGGGITLTVTQNGTSATYTDGVEVFSGTINGCVFTFEKTSNLQNSTETGTFTLNSENTATKQSTWRAANNTCGGECTDYVSKVN